MFESALGGSIIHDLKNPLAGITGTVSLFSEGLLGPLTEEQKKNLGNIQLGAAMLSAMLDDLQFVINFETGETKPQMGAVTVGEILAGVQWQIDHAKNEEKSVKVQTDDSIRVRSDKSLTTRILSRLLDNAVKQTSRGGKITLTIKRDQDKALFEVKDDGEPVPSELSGKIFEKLFKIEHPELKMRVGRGLALYFCKLAVEALGGRISVESTAGKGARFFFHLPLAQ